MELLVWIVAAVFTLAGAILGLWHLPGWKKVLGLISPGLYGAGMAGVVISARDIDGMTPLFWAIFYLVLPALGGFVGYLVMSAAHRARQVRIYQKIKG